MKLKSIHFLVIKNTIKRIAFKNAYESLKIFQSFLYTSIPAEYLRLMRPLSLYDIGISFGYIEFFK